MSAQPAIGYAPIHGEHGRTAYRWNGQPARAPKAGEFFISGALPVAYRANADLSTAYFIAVPVDPLEAVRGHIRRNPDAFDPV